jgi:hypothetical protein
MSNHPSQDSIVVLEASLAHGNPGEIVGSNVWFVNALLDEYLTTDEIAADAVRSYYVDYYLAEVNNGGFSQFVYNSRWDPEIIAFAREGLRAMSSKRHLEVFEEGVRLVEEIGPARLKGYFASEYFGENMNRDELNALNDDFSMAEQTEDLLALNAAWLRNHPRLWPIQTVELMREEARRRGQVVPDRERRIAEARAREPRYMKLIRLLCESAGQELDRVTAGDPAHIHEGSRTVAWHFITDKGHHHMVDTGRKAIMFRGHSDRVCELEAPDE